MHFDIGHIAVQYFCLLFSLCVHEAAHAAMANWCGDSTARMMGRLTLDPRKHIDPLGTVILPLLALSTGLPFLFGWAKPVPFVARFLNNRRRDPVLIAMAGPASNLLIALAATFILRIFVITGIVHLDTEAASGSLMLGTLMQNPAFLIPYSLIAVNLVLMLFNLIPVPPLDGHYVVKAFLPPYWEERFEQIGPYGLFIVIFFGGRLISGPLMLLMGTAIVYVLTGFSGF